MSAKKPGRIKQRLIKLLENTFTDVCFDVSTLFDASGWYRTSVQADTYRWEAHGTLREHPNINVVVYSYDTMTNCLRRGITYTRDHVWEIDVSAKREKEDETA